jgi:multisubunit Na+/H+ antiporter MnhG subunit
VRALRVCAIVVLIVGVLFTGWLALGAPGLPRPSAVFDDPYYRMVRTRGLVPFTAALAGIALIVVFAARTAMARRRLGAVALWLILAGDLCLLVSNGLEIWLNLVERGPRTLRSLDGRYLDLFSATGTSTMLGATLLLLGVLLWIVTRLTGRRR